MTVNRNRSENTDDDDKVKLGKRVNVTADLPPIRNDSAPLIAVVWPSSHPQAAEDNSCTPVIDITSFTTNGWQMKFFGSKQKPRKQKGSEVENLRAQVQELQEMVKKRDLDIKAYKRSMNEMMVRMKKKDEALKRQGIVNQRQQKHAQTLAEKVVDKRDYIRNQYKEIKDLKKRLNEQGQVMTGKKEKEVKNLRKKLAKKDDVIREQEKELKRLRSLHHQQTQELRKEMEILRRRDKQLRKENRRLEKQLKASLIGAKKTEGLRRTEEDILRLDTVRQEPQRETSSLREFWKEIEDENERLRREMSELSHRRAKRKEALTQRRDYKSTKFPQDTNLSDVLLKVRLKARRNRNVWNLYENGLMTREMEKSVDKKRKDTRLKLIREMSKIKNSVNKRKNEDL
ncbi:golgin subfamily A member 6-like protein 7 [Macrobrachium rosenbergii]|uniref:golgin subfamily A member 6-like protein 7 n=1 Tax=Macrobrachium rosenbergii TaxID=79674 RepID=UPI0034D5C97D